MPAGAVVVAGQPRAGGARRRCRAGGRDRERQVAVVQEVYGRSGAGPGSETAPGPGRSPAPSTVALKVGWMQKMLTSVEAWPNPSVMSPAGAPVSVIVWAPPPAGPKAPGLACWQSGHEPLPSVQAVDVLVSPLKHCLGGRLQPPVPRPVQQGNGVPAAVHPLFVGHPVVVLPSKQLLPVG